MPRSERPGTPLEVPGPEGTLDRALALVRLLRAHCAWDAAQTATTLVPHLLEETHEVVGAIYDNDADALEGELGCAQGWKTDWRGSRLARAPSAS